MLAHVKKNDTVKVLTGREKGRTGRVLRIVSDKFRAEVEGLMTQKRHTKRGRSQANPEGGIIDKIGTIHLSNLIPVCPKCNEASRPKHLKTEAGKPYRACRNCGANLDEKKA